MTARRMTMLAAAAALAAGAGHAQATEFARVVSATPVLSQVGVPRQDCVEVQRVVQSQPSGVGALLGAVVGGVVGHQIGGGGGRAVATGVGAIAGAVAGNQIESNNGYATAYPSRNCRTVTTSESRVVGYDVVYEYNGQRYSTRTAGDPGPRLAIDIRPATTGRSERGERYERSERYEQARPVPPVESYSAVPPTYVESLPPRYVQQSPVYVEPAVAPVYYSAPYYSSPYYAPYYGRPYWGPTFSIGIGGYWGGHGGYHHGGHHWRH